MSYCSGNWFSDYNYRLMQVFLTPSDRTLSADVDRAQVQRGRPHRKTCWSSAATSTRRACT